MYNNKTVYVCALVMTNVMNNDQDHHSPIKKLGELNERAKHQNSIIIKHLTDNHD